MEDLKYQSGFGNHFCSEALPNTLPTGQNSPQKVRYGLYAEQLSGSAFTAPRKENLRSWLYRIRPSVLHSEFIPVEYPFWRSFPFREIAPSPNQMRWDPFPVPKEATDLIEGIVSIAGNGSFENQNGCAVHIYRCNRAMEDHFFYNADGELLFVPESGALRFRTEMGILEVKPGEIAVIPRGVRFQSIPLDGSSRGYLCENYGMPFRLPELGPIGANGLANPRDFQVPVACYEEKSGPYRLVAKFHGQFWESKVDHSVFDVVAWHGNYCPYKYDLRHFNTINTVSFDHPDPSIFTVLTSPTFLPGTANVDFVIFPPRWMVADHTFRPPWFHRNIMSEFMGLIQGSYDAKAHGFVPGGCSLHNSMSGHGPDADVFSKATSAELKPQRLENGLAFMFESSLVFHTTAFAMNHPSRQKNYLNCWSGLKSNFNPHDAK